MIIQCSICKNNLQIQEKVYCKSCTRFFIHKEKLINVKQVEGGGKYIDNISKNMGNNAESRFVKICNEKELAIRPSNSIENRINHYDFIFNYNHQYFKIEVKSMKSRKRGLNPDPSILYLELNNIEGGFGWIYGDSDYIAFEQEKGFVLFNTKQLQKVVSIFFPKLPYVIESGKDFTLYGRKNRKDLVMILPFAVVNYYITDKIFL